MTQSLSREQIQKYRLQLRQLSNTGKYRNAYELASSLMRRHPDVIEFAYIEAVMTAEETRGLSSAEIDRKYKLAAKKLRKLRYRIRAVPIESRGSFRNEYYWFSRQPRKQ